MGLIPGLLVAMGAVQAGLLLLARGFRLRLHRHAVAAGLLLPWLVLAPWIFGGSVLAPTGILGEAIPGAPQVETEERHGLLNDVIYQILPWEREVCRHLAAGRWPFWSDLLEGGSSPWVNPQAAALSPLAMAARLVPLESSLLVALALKMLVALQGTWLLCRVVGARREAALLAGTAFALGGGLMAWALFPYSSAVVWVPWLIVGVIRLVRRPDRRILATTALVFAILLFSGHLETAFGGGVLAAVAGLGLLPWRRGFVLPLGGAAAATILGFGLAAPQMLPVLQILPESQRVERMLARRSPDLSAIVGHRPDTWFGGRKERILPQMVNPRAFGRPYREPRQWTLLGSAYPGLLVVASALMALIPGLPRRLWPFLGFAIAGLLLAADFLPLMGGIRRVPLLQVVAFDRFLPVVGLGLCVLASVGLSRLLRRPKGVTLWIGLGAGAALSLLVRPDGLVLALWGLVMVAALVSRLGARWGIAALAACLAADLVPWTWDLLPRGNPRLFYPSTALVEVIQRETGEHGAWRAVGEDYNLYPHLLPTYGVPEIRYHNPLVPVPYAQVLAGAFEFHADGRSYFSPFRNPDHPLLDFLNVRVLISNAAMAPPRTLRRVDRGEFGVMRLYRNPDALSRWFLAPEVEVVPREEVVAQVAALKDPRRVILELEEVGSWRPPVRVWEPEAMEVRSALPGRVHLQVKPGPEGLLVASLASPRGWHGVGDGRRLDTVAVNGAFLGVRLPAGVREVILVYLPPGFLSGLAAMLLSGLLTVGLFLAPPGGRRGGAGSLGAAPAGSGGWPAAPP